MRGLYFFFTLKTNLGYRAHWPLLALLSAAPPPSGPVPLAGTRSPDKAPFPRGAWSLLWHFLLQAPFLLQGPVPSSGPIPRAVTCSPGKVLFPFWAWFPRRALPHMHTSRLTPEAAQLLRLPHTALQLQEQRGPSNASAESGDNTQQGCPRPQATTHPFLRPSGISPVPLSHSCPVPSRSPGRTQA